MPRMVRRRPLALAVALIAVALAGPADAKKKKGGKKPKTPSGKSSGKSLGAEPKDTSSDDSSSSSAADEPEEESKPAAKIPPPDLTDQKPPSESDAEDKPAPKKKKEAAAEGGGDDDAGPALPALEFVAGAGALFRNLAYNDDRSMTVAPYSLAPGPQARIGLDLYPAAFAMSGFAANIGLTAQLGYGFGVKSQTMSGSQLTTQFMDYAAGLKLRIPLGMATPYLFATYASQIFQLTGQNPPATGAPVPAVAYSIIRPGLGGRFVFTPMIDLDVSAAFLLLLDAGQIRSMAYWPHTTGNGFEAAMSIGVRFTPLIGLRAGVDFRQYGLAFNWRSGEPNQSGGAIDRYIVAWGGLQITLDGVGGGASEAPAEEKPAKGKKKKKAEPEPEEEATE